MAKRKQNNKLIIGTILSALLIVGTGTLAYLTKGFQDWSFNQNQKNDDLGLETEIKSSGLELRLLNTTENEDGSITKSFNFTIKPKIITNKNLVINSKYKDGTLVDESVLEVTYEYPYDNSGYINIICKQAFSQQIEVNIASESNSEVKAIIKVDYVKKVLNVETKENVLNSYYCFDNNFNSDTIAFITMKELENYDINQFLNITYSQYSKDKNYTFKLSSVTSTLGTTDFEAPSNDLQIEQNRISDTFKNKIETEFMKKVFLDNEEPFEALWNLAETDDDRVILKYYSNDQYSYASLSSTFNIVCEQDNKINYSFTLNFWLCCYEKYAAKEIPAQSLNFETTEVEF